MKLDFFIFRHGETEWNRLRRIQGHSNIPLNETGKKQAEGLKEILAKFHFDHVFSSDLERAFETARIALPNYEIKKTELLREAFLGEAEGLTIDEINTQFGIDFWTGFVSQNAENSNYRFPGGESVQETNTRILKFIDSVVNNHELYQGRETTNIILSSHGAVIRNILGHLFPLGEGKTYDIPNCVTYKITYDLSNRQWTFGGMII